MNLDPSRSQVNACLLAMNERGPKKAPVKKIPTELRRRVPRFRSEKTWHRRLFLRLREDSQFLRSTVQFLFVLLCLWIGVEFYLFMEWGVSGGISPFHERPPGVEGFLPISALMSLEYWFQTGIINEVHPSGMFILVAIVAGAMLLKKSFCSWLCPIGTLSESLWMMGKKLFGTNVSVPRWIDLPLRSLKYLLLLFFLVSIVGMREEELATFINSPYNKVADVKMYMFFAAMSDGALWTLIALLFLSVPIKNFWCRYLCPYGALLGAVSWVSPLKVTRTTSTCVDCELCTRACPSNIAVHKANRIWSDECMSCLACIDACPVKNTLELRTKAQGGRIRPLTFALLVVAVFVGITGAAILTDRWQNSISREEYLMRFKKLDSPVYQHARGQVPEYSPND